MIKIEINNLEFLVKPNISVLEACKFVGINIPRFCYHETLSVAGNCRMCVVEVANSPKPVASCALPVLNNMKIFVNTPVVKKARENVLETLLLNHPLDCPICDQGGECDLQDQTKAYGSNFSRFFFNKRSVEDKFCGPLIKTIMTRCIHCTRCVRFGSEIAGVEYLGTLGRGTFTEIGGYFATSFRSEISGNVIDLCPVGALTSKPYAFKTRPWELKSTESIDVSDSTGSNVYVNFKESEIFRVIPKVNNEINDSIISDKARFSYDGNKINRINKVFVAQKGQRVKFKEERWSTILDILNEKISGDLKTLVVVNDEIDLQTLNVLKLLSNRYSKNLTLKSISQNSITNHFVSKLTDTINDLKNPSNVCLLISSNIRLESAIINTKLRLKYSNEDFNVFSVGRYSKSNFLTQFINLSFDNILRVLEGKDVFVKRLLKFKNPIFCIGASVNKYGTTSTDLISAIKSLFPSSKILDIKAASNSAGLEMVGIKKITKKDLLTCKTLFLVNLETTVQLHRIINSYMGCGEIFWFNTHGSKLAIKSNYILPTLTEYEEEKIFLNLEQRPQKTMKTVSNISNSRSLSDTFNLVLMDAKALTYQSYLLEILRDSFLYSNLKKKFTNHEILTGKFCNKINLVSTYPLKSNNEDFYLTTKVGKNSLIMNECSQDTRKSFTNF